MDVEDLDVYRVSGVRCRVSGVRREFMNSVRLVCPFLLKPETTGLRIMSV